MMESSREIIRRKFQKQTGISLHEIGQNQSLLKKCFSKGNRKTSASLTAGRGYPFFSKPGISAENKDKRNLEILAKW
ncbi:MAG: hypothetical protein ACLSHI_09825 [Akkermansia sp.]|nr:hypothetical protein [Akkermansia muciniphila]MBT8774959.1 hypothetical protein [Akkermansia muciniphila]